MINQTTQDKDKKKVLLSGLVITLNWGNKLQKARKLNPLFIIVVITQFIQNKQILKINNKKEEEGEISLILKPKIMENLHWIYC